MGLDVWFREDIAHILAAVAVARDGLTSDERTILAAICAGFGISMAEVLPPSRQAMMQLPEHVGRTVAANQKSPPT